MLFISLGLHGLLFTIPLPLGDPELSPDAELSVPSVPLAKLPVEPSVSPSPPIPSPKPSQPLRQIVGSVPSVRQAPKGASPKLVSTPPPDPPPSVPSPTPTPTLTPSPTPTPSPSPTPTPTLTPSPTPTPSPSSTPSPIEPDGPQFQGATSGYLGCQDCYQVEGQNYKAVHKDLISQLEQQGYTLRDDLDDPGRIVYEREREGQAEYFHIFSSLLGGAVYITAPRILELEDLDSFGSESRS